MREQEGPLSSGQVGHHRLLQGTRRRNLSPPACPCHPEPPQRAPCPFQLPLHGVRPQGPRRQREFKAAPLSWSLRHPRPQGVMPRCSCPPTLRAEGSSSLRRAWGGTGASGSWAWSRPSGLARTAKSRSTLLFLPLGFLCVSEPRYTELRSKESSKPAVRGDKRAAAPPPPPQRFQ